MEAWELQQPTPQQAEKYLMDLLQSDSWAEDLQKYTARTPSADELLEAAVADDGRATPWARPYLCELIRLLRTSDHETVDHPVAALSVVCSDSENPVGEFTSVGQKQMPPLMAQGMMDTNILRHFVLLHDMTSPNCPSAERLAGILKELHTAFGPSAVSVVNIGADGVKGESLGGPAFWTADREPKEYLDLLNVVLPGGAENSNPGSPVAGQGFSLQDSNELNRFVAKFVVKTLLPYMEQKVRTLHHQVSSTRKGLRNQLKSFWTGRRHDQDVANGRGGGSTYAASSPEAQLRVLADLSMMLSDYDLALSHFKLLAGDYKQDRAWKYMAGVQDAIGLCHLALAETSPGKRDNDREAELNFEAAAENYVSAENSPGTSRYASRSMILLAEGFRVRGMHEASTSAYLNAALAERKYTNAVRAALLLEQAAWSHFRCDPPLARKASFHMVLAAHRYNVGSLRQHSRHAYASVAGLYGQGWHHIEEHISFCLARLCGHLGEPTAAISYFLQLLSGPSVGPQVTYLNEFLLMVRQAASGVDAAAGLSSSSIGDGSEKNPLKLRLPSVTPQPKMINFADTVTYATPASASVPDAKWRALEAPLVTEGVAVRTPTWLDLANGSGSTTMEKNMLNCVVDEELSVDVELENILALPLSITRLRLECSYSADEPSSEGKDDGVDDDDGQRGKGDLSTADGYQVLEESLTLEPKEVIVARLRVVPHRAGRMTICGVAWVLEGVAHGRCDLHGLAPKARAAGKRAQSGNSEPSAICFEVLPAMPLLSARVEGIPTSIHSGGICDVTLVLKNVSEVPMGNVRVRFDSPCLMLADSASEAGASECGSDIFLVGDGGLMGKDQEIRLPLWIHAPGGEGEGLQNFLAAISYEPLRQEQNAGASASSRQLKYRVLRLSGSFYVTPALSVSATLIHGLAGGYPGRTRMKLSIKNNAGSLPFVLRQIRCRSATWTLEPLPGDLNAPGVISAGQSWNLLFHLAIRKNGDGCDHESALAIGENTETVMEELPFPVRMYHARAQPAWATSDSDPSKTPERCSVLLFWEQYDSSGACGGSRALGAHHLFNMCIDSGPPVRAWMTGPNDESHDFTLGPCTVPVTLHIHNRASGTLTVVMEASGDVNEPADGPLETGNGWYSQKVEGAPRMWTSKLYSWQGTTKRKLQGLAPGEDRTIEMEATIFGSGIIELGDYRLLWFVDGAGGGRAGSIEGEPFIVDVKNVGAAAPAAEELSLSSLTVCDNVIE